MCMVRYLILFPKLKFILFLSKQGLVMSKIVLPFYSHCFCSTITFPNCEKQKHGAENAVSDIDDNCAI